jgi:hypothetical protein
MPGYNHYPSCQCGWCVAHGRTVDKAALRNEMARRTSADFLKRNGASRLGSSCFVAPNATCPVCKASVYFYANSNGSRVFFDELGPPWPKHPCTDRPNVAARVAVHGARPERRKIGLIKEIVGHAWVLDRKRTPSLDRTESPNLDGWRLLLITEVKARGGKVQLSAEFVETIHQHRITLLADQGCHFYVGQFASLRRDVLSFFDEIAGERRDVGVTYEGMKPSQPEPRGPARPSANHRRLDAFGLPAALKTEGIPGPAERAHYIGRDPSSRYFENVKEIIQSAAKKGASYLADFQIVLNDSNLRTLRSSKWTRELVSAVIYDIRHEDKLRPQKPNRATTVAAAIHEADRDKIAKELHETEARIADLEASWDAAASGTQRQKIHDQLSAARRRRTKLFGMLWG